MIKTKNLTRKYITGDSTIYAIRDIDLELKEGEFLAITGRSGSGKSTLLYQLGLLDMPTSGSIHISGIDVVSLSEEERTYLRLSKLGYVFQDYAIIPSLTAIENVVLPLLMLRQPKDAAYLKAREALVRLDLGDRMNNYPAQLSGGQQQRVAIARAIAHDPEILFADEPTANLDSETSEVVLSAFTDLHKDGQTIVMVTHELDYAKKADRVIELSDGKIMTDNVVK